VRHRRPGFQLHPQAGGRRCESAWSPTCRIVSSTSRRAFAASSDRDAARWVEKKRKWTRTLFVKKHFSKDVSDPHNYDLILNMSRLSVEEAVEYRSHNYCPRSRPVEPPASKVAEPAWCSLTLRVGFG